MGLRVAIIGAGMGGLACAAALKGQGADVAIYEQAGAFKRIGAGIQMTPNAVKALRGIGLEEALRDVAFEAALGHNRDAGSGAVTNVLELGQRIVDRCGAPLLTLHRGDLHSTLLSAVPSDVIHMNHRLLGFEQDGGPVTLQFDTGASIEADVVIAADGVHSVVRNQMFGTDAPRFTGRVAYRTTFPASLIGSLQIDDRCKWWGPDRHIVIYYTTRMRSEIYFVTSTPEPDFNVESWSMKGDLAELRAAYADFHPTVRALLDACPDVHKWALVVREPLPSWHEGRVALLGDACHPMTPYMAQGAASAIEDAVILSRCLDGVAAGGVSQALARYQATRYERATAIQQTSAQNTWMREKTDFDWVYGHDVWSQTLA
ncbi:MAG: salicylate 1-monooxygenase [Hyphomicrobiales bacterium]|nr:salicylate 1-monooxygenase [Hyphomicrobiales bacterium]